MMNLRGNPDNTSQKEDKEMMMGKSAVHTIRRELTERIGKLLEQCTPEELELFLLFIERYLTGRR